MSSGCPFQPKCGYTTADGRNDFSRLLYEKTTQQQQQQQQQEEEGHDTTTTNNNNKERGKGEAEDIEKLSTSMEADRDITKPLYFWQLYSLIGRQPIIDIVTDFYHRIYNDHENDWFRNVFARISGPNHHIATQSAYWIDSFGGGKVYHGGNYRLNFHHTYNAQEIMTAKGAKRWMYHMTNALNGYDFATHYDPRIKPCIVTFLKTKMMKYAEEHHWNFVEDDFFVLEEEEEEGDKFQPKNHSDDSLMGEEKKREEE